MTTLNKELNNGRLAMGAVLYMMVYELVTHNRIFEIFKGFNSATEKYH